MFQGNRRKKYGSRHFHLSNQSMTIQRMTLILVTFQTSLELPNICLRNLIYFYYWRSSNISKERTLPKSPYSKESWSLTLSLKFLIETGNFPLGKHSPGQVHLSQSHQWRMFGPSSKEYKNVKMVTTWSRSFVKFSRKTWLKTLSVVGETVRWRCPRQSWTWKGRYSRI